MILIEEIWFYLFVVVAFLKPQNKEASRTARQTRDLLFDCKNTIGELYLVANLRDLVARVNPRSGLIVVEKQAVHIAGEILAILGIEEDRNHDLFRRIDRAFKRDKNEVGRNYIETSHSGTELHHLVKNRDTKSRSTDRYIPDFKI